MYRLIVYNMCPLRRQPEKKSLTIGKDLLAKNIFNGKFVKQFSLNVFS